MAKQIQSLEDIVPDDMNANDGTERGNIMLGWSLETFGLGRSILLDRDGRVIAGNKTLQKAVEEGLVESIDDVVVVPTNGRKLVAVQRTDLSLDDERGRGLATSDNRSGEINLAWNPANLAALGDMIDLSPMFRDDELDKLTREPYDVLDHFGDDEDGADEGDGPSARPQTRLPLAIILARSDHSEWEAWKQRQGLRDDTVAFHRLYALATGKRLGAPEDEDG